MYDQDISGIDNDTAESHCNLFYSEENTLNIRIGQKT